MANTITITDSGAQSILSDERMLALYQQAEVDILTTGASYSIEGSRSFTAGDLKMIRGRIAQLERRILYKKGFTGRNHADHSGRGVTVQQELDA